jgi:hypothetical protein
MVPLLIWYNRKHAKVDDALTTRTTQLETADFEAAKKEWETLVLSDDEDMACVGASA